MVICVCQIFKIKIFLLQSVKSTSLSAITSTVLLGSIGVFKIQLRDVELRILLVCVE